MRPPFVTKKRLDFAGTSAIGGEADIRRSVRFGKCAKTRNQPKAKLLDARAVRFSEPRRGYALSLGSALATSRAYLANDGATADRPISLGSRRARSQVPTTREARRWSIVNLSIIVSNICKALMNVCAMVRSVSP